MGLQSSAVYQPRTGNRWGTVYTIYMGKMMEIIIIFMKLLLLLYMSKENNPLSSDQILKAEPPEKNFSSQPYTQQ